MGNTKKKDELPPAPSAGKPVKVALELTPDWLEAHNLEIVGWDEKLDGILVRKRTKKAEAA